MDLNNKNNINNNGSKEGFMRKYKEFEEEGTVRVLYSELQERKVNPALYDNKVKFWKEVLRDYQQTYNKGWFTEEEVVHFFEWKKYKAALLPSLLRHLLHTGQVLQLEKFNWQVNERERESWLSYSLRLSLLPFSFLSSSSLSYLSFTSLLHVCFELLLLSLLLLVIIIIIIIIIVIINNNYCNSY